MVRPIPITGGRFSPKPAFFYALAVSMPFLWKTDIEHLLRSRNKRGQMLYLGLKRPDR
jgi:hypothetical protein